MLDDINIQIAGENALIVYFSQNKNNDTATRVLQAQQHIQGHLSDIIIDLVASYSSILVVFNMLKTNHHQLRSQLRVTLLNTPKHNVNVDENKVVQLPVYYSTESGPELSLIARQSQLSVEQVIEIHQQQQYRVYAIGFAPGFAYLGDISDKIATPRLATPRMKVPKGAVAIADKQTAVYPSDSPGGWNIIGLCPIEMFDINVQPSMPVQVGDKVEFHAISKQEFLALGGKLESMIGNG